MFTGMTVLAAMAFAGVAERPTDAGDGVQSFRLTGVIRDFKSTHGDFQFGGTGWIKGVVLEDLGADGKPRLDLERAQRLNWDRKKIGTRSEELFNEWFRDIPGTNVSIPHTIELERETRDGNTIYAFAREGGNQFFPINSQGYGPSLIGNRQWTKNYHFTFELDTTFTYTDPSERDAPLVFKFTGDDDVWVFINGKLAVDIGGVKTAKSESIDLDANAEYLGIEPGGEYQLKLFFAERQTTQSNFRMETNFALKPAKLPTISGLAD